MAQLQQEEQIPLQTQEERAEIERVIGSWLIVSQAYRSGLALI